MTTIPRQSQENKGFFLSYGGWRDNNKEGLYGWLRYARTIARRNGARRLEICKNNCKE